MGTELAFHCLSSTYRWTNKEGQQDIGGNIEDVCDASTKEDSTARPTQDTQEGSETWMRQMPSTQPLEIERILDTQVAK